MSFEVKTSAVKGRTMTGNACQAYLKKDPCLLLWVNYDREALTVRGQKYTFSSCELRSINVKMQPVDPIAGPPLNVVQQRAPSQRKAAQASPEQIRNIAHVQRNPVAPPPEMKFEIPSAGANKVLLHCCR